MKCRLCGKEFETRRQAHGHMISMHREDYARGGNDLDRFMDGCYKRIKEMEKEQLPQPEGFRLLRESNEVEKRAIDAGFMFIDAAENIYSEIEAQLEGWA